MRDQRELPGIVRFMTAAITLVVVVAVIAGLGAATLGGSLTDFGSGFGGLWGLPALLLTLIAIVLGITAAIRIGRELSPENGRLRIAVLVVVGAWLVAMGYANVAHIVDPCANGWWDANSRIGSQPLCERFGSELNWHTRFHLIAHAAPAAILLAIYFWALQQWGANEPSATDHRRADNAATEPTPTPTPTPTNRD